MTRISLSIIMPSLNEEKNIMAAMTNTLMAFENFHIDGEIIVINDGSTDRTPDIVTDFMKKDSRIRMITHEMPQGIGASFWDGVQMIKKDIENFFIHYLPPVISCFNLLYTAFL